MGHGVVENFGALLCCHIVPLRSRLLRSGSAILPVSTLTATAPICFVSFTGVVAIALATGVPGIFSGIRSIGLFSSRLGASGTPVIPGFLAVVLVVAPVRSSTRLGSRLGAPGSGPAPLPSTTLTLVTLVTLLVPIIIFIIFPKKAEKVLDSLKAWLTKHNRVIGVAVLLVFGAYLLTKGLRILL